MSATERRPGAWAKGVVIALAALLGVVAPLRSHAAPAPTVQDPPAGRAAAVVDLATRVGADLVHGQWRASDVKLKEVEAPGPGPDLKPSGASVRTYDYEPKAGTAEFESAAWEPVAPEALDVRRGGGRVSFVWYRIDVTLPERVGAFEVRGSTVAFEVVVDDYAEVWVDGALPTTLGQSGAGVVRGFNAPNRVILTRDAAPGRTIHLAVFGINGPISKSPENFVWIKSATLDFYPGRAAGEQVELKVLRVDPALDAIVPQDVSLERLASGFLFTEGPVWVRDGGYLLFSDPNDNVIYRYDGDGSLSIYRTKSGYAGVDIGDYPQPGSNGLTVDREGRVVVNQHGNRRVVRLEKNGQVTVLADRYDGKRLNSPNDLVVKSDGSVYFTDPPFGLPKVFDDSRKELAWSGVYRAHGGRVDLLARDLEGPNGLAFSPDERFLYVDDWDPKRKVVLRYPVTPDGTLGKGEVFFDMSDAPGEDALDGLKVDQRGNVYVSGPGGLWILSPEGKHLGTIVGPEHPHNFAWGDGDGRSLYLAARTGLYRVRLSIPGVRP